VDVCEDPVAGVDVLRDVLPNLVEIYERIGWKA